MSKEHFDSHCKVENGVLTVSAQSSDVDAGTAATIYTWALEHEPFNSLIIRDCAEYKEPYYWTVDPWVEGLIQSKTDCLHSFRIEAGTTMNRQFGNYIGDITPVLKNNNELNDLYLIGAFTCSDFSHDRIERLCIANCYLKDSDIAAIANASLPCLTTFAIYSGDADLATAEFNSAVVDSLSQAKAENLSEIYFCAWDQCDDVLRKLSQSDLFAKLKLLHIEGFEFGYDPEETVEYLISSADELNKIPTLRIPFKGLMDEEIAQVKEKLPGLENSVREYPEKSLSPL